MPPLLLTTGAPRTQWAQGNYLCIRGRRDCVLHGSEMDSMSNPGVEPSAMEWAAAKLRPQIDLPLTWILRPCLSPSHLAPSLFIPGAFLLLRTETLGHSVMCWYPWALNRSCTPAWSPVFRESRQGLRDFDPEHLGISLGRTLDPRAEGPASPSLQAWGCVC